MAKDNNNTVYAFSDGSALGNPGPGGYGVVLKYGDNLKELSQGYVHTTNNRMELMAAIQALRALDRPCRVALWTDSQYVRKGITEWIHGWQKRGWKPAAKQSVKNAELWRDLLAEPHRHAIEWHWVKGHSGHEGNEAADRLVNEAIDEVIAKRRSSVR